MILLTNSSSVSSTLIQFSSSTTAMLSSSSLSSSPLIIIALNFFFKHIYLLLLVLIGGVGNAFVIVIFGQKTLRTAVGSPGYQISVYPFLFYMAISDTIYLMILFCLWLSNYVNVLHRQGVCQFTLYMTYVCNFINAYYTIAFTTQRLFAVIKPFRVSHVLSWYRSKCLALCIIIFGFILYSYLPFLIGIVDGRCFSRAKTRWINEFMDIIDCIIVFLIPYIMVISMNSIILVVLRRLKQNTHEVLFQKDTRVTKIREISRRNASRKMTKLLLTVSTAYLIICAPYACVHTWRLLHFRPERPIPKLMLQFEHYFHYIYHISFAMNFYIYIVFGSKFRRESKRLFTKWRINLQNCFRQQTHHYNETFQHDDENNPNNNLNSTSQMDKLDLIERNFTIPTLTSAGGGGGCVTNSNSNSIQNKQRTRNNFRHHPRA